MGGSKKGERRGGAKPGHVRKSAKPKGPPAYKAGPGRPKGSKNKPKETLDREMVLLLNKRGVSIASREKDLEMYFTVTGRRDRLPKDVLLTAMRYFEESAIEYSEVLRANMEAEAAARTPEERLTLAAAVAESEGKVDKYVSMAADVAFKTAPYIHPRLAAFMTNPAGDKSASTLFDMLMRDLDQAGKPARYIDHDASEVVK